MSVVVGDVLVGLAVLASALYAAATLGPKPWRARAFAALAAAVLRLPARLGARALAQQIADRLTAASNKAGGCGGCGDCGSAATAQTPPQAREMRFPVEKIGRRE